MYKHKYKELYLKLIKTRESNINSFLEVDELGVPIVKKRNWSVRPQKQLILMIGFDKLIKL